MTKYWASFLVSAALGLSASGAAKAECTLNIDPKCWAAIAVGPDGSFGAATHVEDRKEAAAAAFKACGGACKSHYIYSNSCAAIAYGGDGIWGFGHTVRNLSRAARRAVKECSKNGGVSCAVKFEACSRP